MFDLHQSNSIIIQTSAGNNIDNSQFFEISKFELNQYEQLESRYRPPNVTFKNHSPTPIYNCHGMTFASRRTGIYEPQEISKILREDNYKEIVVGDVQAGDVIIYFDVDGDASHSGIVVSSTHTSLRIPLICSKWGKYKEAIHWANQCPYMDNPQGIKYYRVNYERQ